MPTLWAIARGMLERHGLATVRIGPHALRTTVLLAPMSGVTDLRVPAPGARSGCRTGDHGDGRQRASRHAKARRPAHAPGRRLQALRHTTRRLRGALDGEGARVAEELGADIIDINMGCPAREVTGKLSGSALMRDLDHALADRSGRRRREGACHAEDAARLGPRQPQRAGAGAPGGSRRRTTADRARAHALPVLQGQRRLGLVRHVKDAVRIPVVVNGDIVDPASAAPRSRPPAPTLSWSDAAPMARPGCSAGSPHALATGSDPGSPPLAEQGAIARATSRPFSSRTAMHGLRNARKHVGWYLASSGPTGGRARQGLAAAAVHHRECPRRSRRPGHVLCRKRIRRPHERRAARERTGQPSPAPAYRARSAARRCRILSWCWATTTACSTPTPRLNRSSP